MSIVIRWFNDDNFRERLFLQNNTVVSNVYEWNLGPNDLNSLTEVHKKFLFKYLDNFDAQGRCLIELNVPYVDDGTIRNNLKVLNKLNISGLELVRELKEYEHILAIRKEEQLKFKQTKRIAQIVRDEASKAKLPPKKRWYRFW